MVRSLRPIRVAALATSLFSAAALFHAVHADNVVQLLPLSHNWTDIAQIASDDNWSGVPGIVGYRGDDLVNETGVDPRTVTADGTATPVHVLANQTSPNTLNTGGVAEFHLANPVVALNGSGTADAPFLLININTSGVEAVNVAYNLRDLDGSIDNAVSPVALQYRVGNSGTWTNIPDGYVADATTGPNEATLVTPVSANLPPAAINEPVVQLRIITTNSVGNDEWIGTDDITVTTDPTPPSGTGAATPTAVLPGQNTLLTVRVTPGANPRSTGLAVIANLLEIGGMGTQPFFDDGTNGDVTPGDNVFSFLATIDIATAPGSYTLGAAIQDDTPRSAEVSIALRVTAGGGCSVTHTIAQIQGAGAASALAENSVTTTGVVTARKFNGYYLQMTGSGDSNPATSDGIFVFTSSMPPANAAIGTTVCVTANVAEFPAAGPNGLSLTELTTVTNLTVTGTAALPAPIGLTTAELTPSGGLLQLEKYEGMRVRASLAVVAPTEGNVTESSATSNSNGVFFGVISGTLRPFREPGVSVLDTLPSGAPCCVPRFDENPELLRVDSDAQIGAGRLDVSTGATVDISAGVLDHGGVAYTILPDPGAAIAGGNRAAVPVPAPAANEFTVGSFNLERFFDSANDPGTSDPVLTSSAFNNRLSKVSLAIRNSMHSPDILGIAEAENLASLEAIAARLNADIQPNPGYVAHLAEGNDPGGIDVGFLVKTSRVSVISAVQEGKNATYLNPENGQSDILNDRPPLVLRASLLQPGADAPFTITVIMNHLRSLNDINDPAEGNRVRDKRRAQAEFLANLIQTRQTADPSERIVVIGDFNAFEFSDGYVDLIGTIQGAPAPANEVLLASTDLVNPNLTDLMGTLRVDDRYSYVFNGSAQSLDHVLVNPAALRSLSRFAVARNNADYPEALRNDATRPERISDHDMPVAYFAVETTSDVSGRVSISNSGLLYNWISRTYNGSIKVTNVSGELIQGPIHVVLDNLTEGVRLVNATGTSGGDPYLTLPGVASLPPNASATIEARVENPSHGRVDYSVKVLSGRL